MNIISKFKKQMNTKKKRMSKTVRNLTNRKTNLNKNKELFCIVKTVGDINHVMTDLKTNPNHAINSYLLHMGDEKSITKTQIAKVTILGTPLVKTTREITIKK